MTLEKPVAAEEPGGGLGWVGLRASVANGSAMGLIIANLQCRPRALGAQVWTLWPRLLWMLSFRICQGSQDVLEGKPRKVQSSLLTVGSPHRFKEGVDSNAERLGAVFALRASTRRCLDLVGLGAYIEKPGKIPQVGQSRARIEILPPMPLRQSGKSL